MRSTLRSVRLAGLCMVMASVMSGPALAQGSAPVSDTTECPKEVAAIATCYSAKHPSGAYLLAAIPNAWNGHLVVFAHGGPAVVPPTANTSKTDLAKYAIAVERGFGWVASSYRREGYGVQMAVKDTEALVDECTGLTMAAGARSALQKQNLANILGVMRFPEALLLRHMQAATFLFREIGERTTGGRNAFSNVGVTYKGSTDDA